MSSSRFNKGFSSLIYNILIIEGGHDVKKIAAEINVAPATLYEYIRDEATFPPDLVSPLFKATGDRRILSYFLNPCHQIFFEVPEIDCAPDAKLIAEMLTAEKEHLDVMRKAVEAVKDGEVTLLELEAMEKQVYASLGATARLFECLRRYRGRGKK